VCKKTNKQGFNSKCKLVFFGIVVYEKRQKKSSGYLNILFAEFIKIENKKKEK